MVPRESRHRIWQALFEETTEKENYRPESGSVTETNTSKSCISSKLFYDTVPNVPNVALSYLTAAIAGEEKISFADV